MKKLVLIALVIICALSFAKCSDKTPVEESEATYNCTVTGIDGEPSILISWDKNILLDRVEITVRHGDLTVSSMAVEGEILSRGEIQVEAFYGRHEVDVLIVGEGGRENVIKSVSLSADEYVIAPISGSMPQLYFTLYMDEITNNYTVPTYVWLTRPNSWSWDELPRGVYPMPTVGLDEVLTHNNYDRMVEVTDAYIEELFSINPNAKFRLYINDYNLYLYPKLMTANGIPEENYEVVLLSDGGASYAEFNAAFDSEEITFDAVAKYREMAAGFDVLLDEVSNARDYDRTGDFSIDTSEVRQYAYVAAKEKNNVEWWVLRPRINQTFFSPDKEFLSMVEADIVSDTGGVENPVILERGFASPLTNMDEGRREELKKLYNFSEEMFALALEKNKTVMMLLGSWADDVNEPDFEAYVKFMKAYYGDDFVYYYKGHPSTPTSNYPHKAEQLEKLDLTDVESSINAELILFFHPDIYMCGYNSSTFMSASSDEMACAIFNMRAESCPISYKHRVGVFVSRIIEREAYPECKYDDHEYFLVEYNREESLYKYSVYDATADKIIHGPRKT